MSFRARRGLAAFFGSGRRTGFTPKSGPCAGAICSMTRRCRWRGEALVITPLPPSQADTGFGFSWFTKKLFAERRLMKDVVCAALTMHLIALSVPIFFQLLVDKVIPNQAFSTLYALSAGVGV